jgi:hypothetical protein
MTEDDVKEHLRRQIAKIGSQSEFARRHKIAQPTLSTVLRGVKGTINSPKILDALGLERHVSYRKKRA